MDLSATLVTAAITSVGALFASWIGTKFGLRKFRSERSHDAQIAWLHQLAETSRTLANRSRALLDYREKNPVGEAPASLKDGVPELATKFLDLADQMEMYASRNTYLAIQQVVRDINQLKKDQRNPAAYLAEPSSSKVNPLVLSIAGLDIVYKLVASDIRAMLNLEKLDDHAAVDEFKRTGRFTSRDSG